MDYSEPGISDAEARRMVAAARCRDCGCITHTCSLLRGICSLPRQKHAAGCSRPPGRLVLLALAPAHWVEQLRRTMGDEELEAAADAMLAELGEDDG